MKPTMISLALSLPAALLLGTTALWSGPAPWPLQEPGVAKSIAVVDMEKVLKAYPGAAAREKEFADAMEDYRAQLAQLETDMQAKQAQVAVFEPGTEEHGKAVLAFELGRIKWEETGKIMAGRRERLRANISIDLFGEIQRGIEAFAKAQKLQLVLRARQDPAAEAPISVRINTNHARDVLYFDPLLDQSDAVILFLKQWTPKPAGK